MEIENKQNAVHLENHKLEIIGCNKTLVTGITNVESASDTGVVMYVDKVVLTIEGSGLQVQKIDVDAGNVELIGQVKSIKYLDKKRGGLLKKLIK